jgi:hypothetical protein
MEDKNSLDERNVFFKFPVTDDEEDNFKESIEVANNYLNEDSKVNKIDDDKFNDVFKTYSDTVKSKIPTLKEVEQAHLEKEKRKKEKMLCQYCGKMFTTVANKYKHVNRIHEKISYDCSVEGCMASYKDKTNLERHISKIHFKVETNICRFCNMSFFYKRRLTVHEREKHLYHFPYHCIAKCK